MILIIITFITKEEHFAKHNYNGRNLARGNPAEVYSMSGLPVEHYKDYEKVKDTLLRWKSYSYNETNNMWGAVQICHVPHVANQAWLHTLYMGLRSEELTQLEAEMAKIRKIVPKDYQEFLSYTNGAKLFSGNIALFGFSKSQINWNITEGVDAFQPYDLYWENYSIWKRVPPKWLLIGSLVQRAREVYIDLDGRVFECEYRKSEVVREWPSFWELILYYVDFLSTKFDERGVATDPAYHFSIKELWERIQEEKSRKKQEKKNLKKLKE